MSKKHELELVSRLGFGLEEHMGVHVICEEDETTEADLCHRVLWGEAMRLLAQRDKLLAALEALVGTQDDPQNGWRGTGGTDVLFACEYCGKKHPDCAQIVHLDDCPVPKARAAIAEVKGGV